MANILQLRRGTTAQNDAFTGSIAEVTVDTDKKTVVVHDGSTAGGFPHALENDPRIVGALPAATAGTGSVLASGSNTARTLSDRFGEVFHVEDYGAVGDWDGATGTDDTAAIQAAINAAVAAGGGVVEFSPAKTYYVNGRTQNSVGQTNGFHHLTIVGASVSTKLMIRGNGARLYSNRYSVATPDWTDFFYLCSRFDTIEFDSLTFERGPHVITTTGSPTCGLRANFFDGNISKLLRFSQCVFVDCRKPIQFTTFGDIYQYLDKLERLEVESCSFLFPRGSSINNAAGGEQTVSLSRWVKTAIFDKCFLDGCVGGVLPSDVKYPVDGFSYFGATNNIYTNCVFTNTWVETILSAQTLDSVIQLLINGLDANSGNIVQPAVGDSVTVKITQNDGGTLKLNHPYIMIGTGAGSTSSVSGGLPHAHAGPHGAYVVTGFTGDFAGQQNATITLMRISSFDLGVDPKALEFPTGETFSTGGGNLVLVDPDISGQTSTSISNCVFNYAPRVKTAARSITAVASTNTFTSANHLFKDNEIVKFSGLNGGSNISNDTEYYLRDVTANTFKISLTRGGSVLSIGTNVSAGSATMLFGGGVPAIYAGRGTATNISNCHFVGCVTAVNVSDQFHWGPSRPTTIIGNYFHITSKETTRQLKEFEGSVGTLLTNNCVLSGNTIVVDKSFDTTWLLFVGADGTIVTNNTVVVNDVESVSQPTRFIHYNNRAAPNTSVSWKCIIENNYIDGLDNLAYSLVAPQTIGPFLGSINGSISVSGSAPIKIARYHQSPDGSTWTVGVTNDGELEVIK